MPEQKTDTIRVMPVGMSDQAGQLISNAYLETTTNPVTNNKKTWLRQRPGMTLQSEPNINNGSGSSSSSGTLHNFSTGGTSSTLLCCDSTGIYYPQSNVYRLKWKTGEVPTEVGSCQTIYGTTKKTFVCTNYGGYIFSSTSSISYVHYTQVVDATITSGGTGYTGAETITFSDPTTGVMTATHAASAGTVTVTFLHIHGLTTSDSIYFVGDGTVASGMYAIASVPSTTTLTFAAAGTVTAGTNCTLGVKARGTITVSNGAVTEITITQKGIGYTSTPTITFSSGAATALAIRSGFPQSPVPKPTSIDGYIFVAASGTSDIYQSTLPGEESTWYSDEFITVNQYPGTILGLGRQANQVVAMKTDSIEFLYNAGNAEGSTLSRTNQAVIQLGCVSSTAFVDRDDVLFFISSSAGKAGVWKLEGFKETKISTEYIDRLLRDNIQNAPYYIDSFKISGHFFCILTYKNTSLGTIPPNQVFDYEEKTWSQWFYLGIPPLSSSYTKPLGFPLWSIVSVSSSLTSPSSVLHYFGGLFTISDSSTQDTLESTGTYPTRSICVEWYTPLIDMDNMNRKRINSITVICDDETSGTLKVGWSDDGYRSFVPSTATLRSMSLTGRPYVKNCGTSRRRGFYFLKGNYGDSASSTYPANGETIESGTIRIEAIEINYTQYDH